ncbi:LOW QUALITY PROTEIN: prospero homeobox 3 [Osmerus eperlanus]|uniref:LOW QUALITY PROTEIN: prospero homeobox 3 n=1 Tax=Osmerus eperlanus TaxID=29151 RepID=UPI002E14FA9D
MGEGGMKRRRGGREGGRGGRSGGKRRGGAALVASWRRDVMTVKRLRLGRGGEEEEGEEEEERGRRERGREGRRREREELKEQLEEARGRLRELQERVWKAFGETQPPEEERRKRRGGGEEEEEEEEEGEDMAERIYEEEEEQEGGADELSLSLVPSPPLQGSRREERRGDGGERMERGGEGGGGLFLKSVLERAGLWMGCGLVRGEWEGEGGGGEGEEGGQKFAQALKLELGDAVTRVIDRVLRLYTHSHTHTLSPSPPSPPPDMHSLRGERGSEGGGGVWTGRREGGEKGERGETDHTLGSSHALHPPHPNQSRREQSEALPLVTRRLPPPSHSDRPHLLPTHTPASLASPHPATLTPSSPPGPKSPSSPTPTPPALPPLPLPLPLLHYTMQQLFGRSLPPLPPLQKDLLTSDPYLDFPSSSYPPLPLLAVPDRFVEVAEIALREFFTAILSGRDSDPCWKKSIYKIICKLDGPVPDSFKLPGCPMA